MSKKIILIAEIGWNHFGDIELAKKMITAAKNIDGSIAVVVFNQTNKPKTIELVLVDKSVVIAVQKESIQTIKL